MLLNKILNYGIIGYYLQHFISQMFIAYARCRINENVKVNSRDRLYLGDFLASDGRLRKISNKDATERLSISMIFLFH